MADLLLLRPSSSSSPSPAPPSASHGSRSLIPLFGPDTDSSPLWFNKFSFTAPDFQCHTYVADLRKFVPLDTLRSELRSHLRLLKNELVELINRDYADFVNLSTKLVDVDGAVLRMRSPLIDLRSRLVSVRESVHNSLSALQDGLTRRAEASQAREILEHLLDASHVVSKIEKLLVELKNRPEEGSTISRDLNVPYRSNGASEDPTDSTVKSQSSLLERISSEMNRLNFYVAQMQDLPFVQTMEKRIQNVSSLLNISLQECFEVGLKERNEAVISGCLHAYAAIDNIKGAHEVFRIFVVAPMLEQVFTGREVDTDASDLLEVYLNDLENHIEKQCKFLLDIAMAANSGVQAFDFLGSSILKELHNTIQKKKPGAFSPGKPSIFLVNYKASLKFLDYLEGHCPTKSAINTFRSQPAYLEFLKQWNLGVYFTLRFQEIAGDLDSALSLTSLERTTKNGTELELLSSASLERCLIKCWQPDVHVHSLSDKFLSLTLQLISRYSTWILTGLEARQSGNNNSGVEWAVTASPVDILLVKHDVELLVNMLKGSYMTNIINIFQSAPEEIVTVVRDSIQQGAEALMHVVPPLTNALSDTFIKKCIEVLAQLKGITATYWMTNKPLPVRHSAYVSGILQPLKALSEDVYISYLSDDERAKIIMGIVERVTGRFNDYARELVNSTRKTESSLLRLRQGVLKRGSAGTDSGESNLSATDKICRQLYLDVQEYGRRLDSIGIKAEELPAYISLWQCVAPEAEAQEAD